MPITYNIEESYSYKMGLEKGEKKAIIAMLKLGIDPVEIAKHLEVSITLVEEIQQELNNV